VEAARFEEVSADPAFIGAFELVSVRAVRIDEKTLAAITALLKPGGQAGLFQSVKTAIETLPRPLVQVSTSTLIPASRSSLTVLSKA
jgi:hypothetical protein